MTQLSSAPLVSNRPVTSQQLTKTGKQEIKYRIFQDITWKEAAGSISPFDIRCIASFLVFSTFTDAQDVCGRCPLRCSSLPRQKLPACPRDVERAPFVFQFLQRCLKEINTALTFTNCSIDYVSQSHSGALYWPRTQNTQLMSVLLLSLPLPQTLQSIALTKLSKAISVAPWQEESAWVLDDFLRFPYSLCYSGSSISFMLEYADFHSSWIS